MIRAGSELSPRSRIVLEELNEGIQRLDLLQKTLQILFCHDIRSNLVILATDEKRGTPRKSGEPDRSGHDRLKSHAHDR
ncbi:hypothetical protein SynPROS71_00852 [Synechococcus sp. PROS-7-1]|nr:hypothetical protein SynPROS71_00852 [Synechococcus sp. PROS-7-1]